MLLQLFDTVAKRSSWLFDLNIRENGRLIVHLPLIYRSAIYAELEAYARAAQLFAAKGEVQVKIIDDCVFSISEESFENFKLQMIGELLQPEGIAAVLAKESVQLKKDFAESCLQLEKLWIERQPLNRQFETAYSQLVRLIAINLANPFYEAYYLFLHHHKADDKLFQSLKEKYLLAPSFSHLKFYSDKMMLLKEDDSFESVNDFFWNVSFLREHVNVNDNEILNHANYLNNHSVPTSILYDPTGITDNVPSSLPQAEHVFFMLRLLQVNEEYRHYWQARFMRWMKLCFTTEQAAHCNFNELYKISKQYEPSIA